MYILSNILFCNFTGSPTSLPTLSNLYYCEGFSITGSYYYAFNNTNAVACTFKVCNASSFSVSVCDNYAGDTYLRLFDEHGTLLYRNDDYCNLGSQINYLSSVTNCKEFILLSGCYSSTLCTGTPKVTVYQGKLPA